MNFFTQPSFEGAGNQAAPGGYQVVKETLVVQPTSGGNMAPVTPVKEVTRAIHAVRAVHSTASASWDPRKRTNIRGLKNKSRRELSIRANVAALT